MKKIFRDATEKFRKNRKLRDEASRRIRDGKRSLHERQHMWKQRRGGH